MNEKNEPKLTAVTVVLCNLCLDGKGGECHVPGCAMYLNRAPDLSLRDKVQTATTLRDQVREFHVAMNVPADAERPTVISEERLRLRAALIAEEFAETMAAMFDLDADHHDGPGTFGGLGVLSGSLRHICECAPVRVNMPELADGLADLDYVVEGTRLEMGIDGAPIAAEVHRANMSKLGGPVAPNGKRLKPPGWTPPDIAGELRRQGFVE